MYFSTIGEIMNSVYRCPVQSFAYSREKKPEFYVRYFITKLFLSVVVDLKVFVRVLCLTITS